MGNDIKETSVPFDIDRKLTEEEIAETVKYCKHDVEQTVQVFLQRKKDFEAHIGLVKLACQGKPLDMSLISKTKPQLSAIILDATKQEHDDEFEIDFPYSMRIENIQKWLNGMKTRKTAVIRKTEKRTSLILWLRVFPTNSDGAAYTGQFQSTTARVFPEHGCCFLYPSLMVQYNLHSRNISDPKKFVEIYNQRLKYKAEKNPLQAPVEVGAEFYLWSDEG